MIKLKDIIKEMWEEEPRFDFPSEPETESPLHIWNTSEGTPDEVIDMIHYIIKSVQTKLGPQSNPLNYIKVSHSAAGWAIANPHTKGKWILYSPEKRWWGYDIDEKKLVPLNFLKVDNQVNTWV